MSKKNKRNLAIPIIIFVIFIGVILFVVMKRTGVSIQDPQQVQIFEKGGVKVTVLKEGKGETVKDGDTIAIHYIGSFTDGEVFESNVGEEPFDLTLGKTHVIRGWGIGVTGMKVGEKRKIEITPENAYGEKGVPGIVPPNTKLVYEVDLVAIKN